MSDKVGQQLAVPPPPCGQIVSASGDKMVQVWDTMTNRKLFTFQHTAPVCVMAWSPNGRYIASGGDDATIQVWVAP
jgi:WD40 repeat protein